ncbi:hypothetical protein KC351_g124 [Hortaea werneckii]|nr:hypothetical protein KC351_g124 [Hortaea werneckii]
MDSDDQLVSAWTFRSHLSCKPCKQDSIQRICGSHTDESSSSQSDIDHSSKKLLFGTRCKPRFRVLLASRSNSSNDVIAIVFASLYIGNVHNRYSAKDNVVDPPKRIEQAPVIRHTVDRLHCDPRCFQAFICMLGIRLEGRTVPKWGGNRSFHWRSCLLSTSTAAIRACRLIRLTEYTSRVAAPSSWAKREWCTSPSIRLSFSLALLFGPSEVISSSITDSGRV